MKLIELSIELGAIFFAVKIINLVAKLQLAAYKHRIKAV